MKTQKWSLRAEKFIVIKEIYNGAANNDTSFMLSPSVDEWLKMTKNRHMGNKNTVVNSNQIQGN